MVDLGQDWCCVLSDGRDEILLRERVEEDVEELVLFEMKVRDFVYVVNGVRRYYDVFVVTLMIRRRGEEKKI